ncbi:MAG TPA: LLM class flavin-dependent oxidoreductase, partial [Stellaceae bacterium]|nr:LLM class flavin-dependent oxidoreductase [Stellaceae bacterium]
FAVDNNACYCFLSYSGARAANTMMQRYWQVVADKGREPNPYRAGFLQLVAVAATDAEAEAKYAPHIEYFYHKCLHWPLQLLSPAGNQDYRSLVATLSNPVRRTDDLKSLRYGDFVEKGYVIAGSPRTVRDRLREEVVKGLRVGNLMVLLQIGSMPHELAIENIDLFARTVLPELRDEWNEEGWINYWWPERLRDRVGEPVSAAAGGQ